MEKMAVPIMMFSTSADLKMNNFLSHFNIRYEKLNYNFLPYSSLVSATD